MSRDQLVTEYLDGNLSRRKFIHGLVGLGVGAAAAVAFADVLVAQGARAVTQENDYLDYYGTTTTSGVTPTTSAPATGPTIALGATSVEQGGSVVLNGATFGANTDVEIDLHSDPVLLAKVKTDAAGKFQTTLTIPLATKPGAHNVVVHGVDARGAAVELSAALQVLGRSTPTAGPASVRPSFAG